MSVIIDIDKLKTFFADVTLFTTDDIARFYQQENPEISRSTVNWHITQLVQKGVIRRKNRGVYEFGKTVNFVPLVSDEIIKIQDLVLDKFHLIRFCVWQLSEINRFSQHLINLNIILIDVEKDAINYVYYFLKEHFPKVMLASNLYSDISEFNEHIIVRRLVSHSPLQKQNNIYLPTLEKFLVDIAFDKEFFPFQGYEILRIYENALEKYTVNQSKALRYASRKHKKEETAELINKTVNRQ
jgi:predicted transcriptional regulator